MNLLGVTNVTKFKVREQLDVFYRKDEQACVDELLKQIKLSPTLQEKITEQAREFICYLRDDKSQHSGIDGLMSEYSLSSDEGIALMCLAESLLRIPDKATVNKLIDEKLASGQWEKHLNKEGSFFVNATTWGLMITGKVLSLDKNSIEHWSHALKSLAKRSGGGVIRAAIKQAMKLLGGHFVLGETITQAVKCAESQKNKQYYFSYDMLGEAARTEHDAQDYFKAYQDAIQALAKHTETDIKKAPSISVKLSALYPRYEYAHVEAVHELLLPKLKQLAMQAQQAKIGLTVDAEEADRLDLSLDLIEAIFSDPDLKEWGGFGLAVQAYQKRALPLLKYLKHLAEVNQRRWLLRLVKGAYWDSEIKLSQELGLDGFPVYTQKKATDLSYLACAQYLLSQPESFYPQFATHNAYTVATIISLVNKDTEFEFQRLHGMGEALYQKVLEDNPNFSCRLYAPVGEHEHLLGYLIRRLLENGANTSFVNRIANDDLPIEALLKSPVESLKKQAHKYNTAIALPKNIFGTKRCNSKGADLSNRTQFNALFKQAQKSLQNLNEGKIDGVDLQHVAVSRNDAQNTKAHEVFCPYNINQKLPSIQSLSSSDLDECIQKAVIAQLHWNNESVCQRAQCLRNMANLLEEHRPALIALLIIEAGKTWDNAVSEVREAVDFCRYYATEAKTAWGKPVMLPGPTGESNEFQVAGRGVIACISPWNFPLAIFLGQVTAALVTGNAVLAKPAEQTPLVAAFSIALLHMAGVPKDVVQLVPGKGSIIGAQMVASEHIAGVMMTGSTETAQRINQSLAQRKGPIVPLIAETGGQNCMIVDSSALLEQVIVDVVHSAFDSAGQRCSALRVVYVQEDIADAFTEMLVGAMKVLTAGDPSALSTDVGPVIDKRAQQGILEHIEEFKSSQTLLYQLPENETMQQGHFVAPTAFLIDHIQALKTEIFGPVLHVIRYAEKDLNQVIADINSTGFGLTFGMHSRLLLEAQVVAQKIKAGNIYINRNTVGAVVGVQPFGGQGLSGTGPKAGGPYYLHRLITEKTISINTTAIGGNASLLAQEG